MARNLVPVPHLVCDRMRSERGLTFIEILITTIVIGLSVVALSSMIAGQLSFNEHARNVVLAMNDVNRVMEAMRAQNRSSAGCVQPTTAPPSGANWETWLGNPLPGGGGGRSLTFSGANEAVGVLSGAAGSDPLSVSIAVCWTHRARRIGDCDPSDGAVSSPAMTNSFLTCR